MYADVEVDVNVEHIVVIEDDDTIPKWMCLIRLFFFWLSKVSKRP